MCLIFDPKCVFFIHFRIENVVTVDLAVERAAIDLQTAGGFVFVRDLFRPLSIGDARNIVQTYGGCGPELMQRDYFNSLLASFTVEEVGAQLAEAGLTGVSVAMVTDRHWDAAGRITGQGESPS